MKFSIHGFYQLRAVELGLTNDDLLVLRWFVDFAGTKKMKTIIEDDGIYYWINYKTVLEDLPVLRISKQTLKKKHFDNLCNKNVLKHKHIKDGGSFSYYAYGINYDTLVYLQEEDSSLKNNDPTSEFTKGCVQNEQGGTSEFTEGVGSNLPNKDTSIINTSIINNVNKKTNKKFVPPTLEEIENYCKEKNYNIDTQFFYEYFTEGNWVDSKGNKVKNWKQKIITWSKGKKTENKPIKNEWFDKKIEKEELSQEEEEEMKSILNKY